MDDERSVSPVGASRFEQPYAPPSRAASKAPSPTSPKARTSSLAAQKMSHASHSSTGSTTTRTNTTAPSSLSRTSDDEKMLQYNKELAGLTPTTDIHSAACGFPPSSSAGMSDRDADDWFARFRSDPDLSTTLSDDCPDRATLAAVYDLPIYRADGTPQPFGSLYDPSYALHQRQLVLFIRHFYCGACQAYLAALSQAITKEDYFSIPVPTSIFVIGCGQPDLIPQYKKFTECPFPIFADPSRQLFKKLGMHMSVNIGLERPEYMKDISAPAWAVGQVTQIRKSLKEPDGIRKRDIIRGGNPMQIGGEFLFDEGEVVWCHRMRNYRNHAEVGVLRKLLELDE
ncbi:hypothetical protein LTR08_003948 [Meristemomyces frigidus]|nr:hypothetical protein LTR08_003948 [Meristemomyces frigidus]